MSTLKVNTIQDASGNNPTTPALLYNGTAKAWVNFNGTGTIAIRQAYNVTLTDNGVGDYTLNFTTALADANYVAVGMIGVTGAATFGTLSGPRTNVPTTTAFRITTSTAGPTLTDYEYVHVIVIR